MLPFGEHLRAVAFLPTFWPARPLPTALWNGRLELLPLAFRGAFRATEIAAAPFAPPAVI